MRRWIGGLIGLAIGMGVGGVSGVVFAQESGQLEEIEYAYGTVKSVGEQSLVVTEYDYDTGEMTDVTYAIDPAVELVDVNALTEVAPGDGVDLDYVVRENERIAKVIAVEKPIDWEESGAVDEY